VAREGTELIKAFFEAYNARDIGAVEALLDPEVKITTLSGRAGLPERWEGRASTRRYFEQLGESWEELRIEIDEQRETGGCAVAIGHMRGIGKASHAQVVERFATVFVVRNSRFVHIDTFSDPEAALESARTIPAQERAPGAA
jgi:ketosteroid isomerase-like protein